MNSIDNYKFEQLRELMNIIEEKLKIFQSEEVKKTLYKDSKKIGKYCGTNYWAIPDTLNANECQKLYELCENNCSKNKLDELLITHLLRNNEKNLKVIKNNFLNKQYLEKYYKPYRQAFKAYNKKMYLSAVMILIAIFEGISADYANAEKTDTNVQNFTKKYLNKKYNDRTSFLICQDKEAMKSFIDSVFHTGVDFNNENSIKIFNRQPIMHGRFLNQIGKRETLQMFNAINQLLVLIDF